MPHREGYLRYPDMETDGKCCICLHSTKCLCQGCGKVLCEDKECWQIHAKDETEGWKQLEPTHKTSLYPEGSTYDRILKDVKEFEIGEKKFASGKERIKVVFDDDWGNRMIQPLYTWLERNKIKIVSDNEEEEKKNE